MAVDQMWGWAQTPVTMVASELMRSWYLDPVAAGVPWLLPTDSPVVDAALVAAARRTSGDPCDANALAGDLDDLLVLLFERHVGLATCTIDGTGLPEWAAKWRDRLTAEQPTSWGTALGSDFYRLRWQLGDNHLRASGEDTDLLRTVDVRSGEPTHGREAGPIVEEQTINGVLCLRIRQCGGQSHEAERLMRAFEDSHDRFFGHDKIIIDVRSNPGGGDGWAWNWITRYAAQPVTYPPDGCWKVDGQRLSAWNQIIERRAVAGPDAIPPGLAAQAPAPHPAASLKLETEVETIPTSGTPWRGRMLVLTDRGTASAAESAAWMFRQAFDAKLAGGRTGGLLTFGDLAPYLLPRSGLHLQLATHTFGWTNVEMTGLPVDLELDPRTPLAEIAHNFDHLRNQPCQ